MPDYEDDEEDQLPPPDDYDGESIEEVDELANPNPEDLDLLESEGISEGGSSGGGKRSRRQSLRLQKRAPTTFPKEKKLTPEVRLLCHDVLSKELL